MPRTPAHPGQKPARLWQRRFFPPILPTRRAAAPAEISLATRDSPCLCRFRSAVHMLHDLREWNFPQRRVSPMTSFNPELFLSTLALIGAVIIVSALVSG